MSWRRRPEPLTTRQLEQAIATADAADDAGEKERLLRLLIEQAPGHEWAHFDAGLMSKRRRDWAQSAADNAAALALVDASVNEPAAWNLGIAATALGDWARAARAWQAYGVDVDRLAVSRDPLVLRLGHVPIRLNAEPRHLGETALLIDGRQWDTEVVWCDRLCPARGVIRNVPTPESGHRFGDVVLHDGEPVGSRDAGSGQVPVFNELALLESSNIPTLTVVVSAPNPAAFAHLSDVFGQAGLAAEDRHSLVLLCRACSEGDVSGHEHPTAGEDGPDRTFALAGTVPDAVALLERWSAAGTDRRFLDPQRVL